MAYYVNGILIGGANTLPKMTMAEYLALPVSERPTYWECTDKDYDDISAEDVTYGSGTVKDALDKPYKEATFSGTTDSYGLLALTTLPKIIIGASANQGGMLFPFINPYGTCYVRAVGYDGSLLSNFALTGKYYYLEAK